MRRVLTFQLLGKAFCILLLITPLSLLVHATEDIPEEAKGYQENGFSYSELDSVNLTNGNLTFRVPLYTLSTSGDLSYDLALYYNSKLWTHRPLDLTLNSQVDFVGVSIADGIQNYGFGWDLRPPRLQIRTACIRYTDCPTPSLTGLVAWVDQSGAKHYLYSLPPWLVDDPDGSAEDYYCDLGTSQNPQLCYTWDGSNIQVVPAFSDDGDLISAEVRLPDGTLYTHDHIVPVCGGGVSAQCTNDNRMNTGDEPGDYDIDDFREDISGLYVSRIRRGPNSIWFNYCSDLNPEGCPAEGGEGPQEWLVSSIHATVGDQLDCTDQAKCRTVDLAYGNHVPSGNIVLESISVPAFDPRLQNQELEPSVTATIDLSYVGQFWVRDIVTPFVLDRTGQYASIYVPRLESIRFPSGAEFAFSSDLSTLPPGYAEPAAENYGEFSPFLVRLPSGGWLIYLMGAIPNSGTNCYKLSVPDGVPGLPPERCISSWNMRDADPPPPISCSAGGAPQNQTVGVIRRARLFRDAAGSDSPAPFRLESTTFARAFNCADSWPYDLRPELISSGLHPSYSALSYYTVAVQTGADSTDHWDRPWLPGSRTAEIHRYNHRNYREVSVDTLEVRQDHPWYACDSIVDWLGDGREWIRDSDCGIEVLTHREYSWTRVNQELPLSEMNERPQDESAKIEMVEQYTNESGTGDVLECYPSTESNQCDAQIEIIKYNDQQYIKSRQVLSDLFSDYLPSANRRQEFQFWDWQGVGWFLGQRSSSISCKMIGGGCVAGTEVTAVEFWDAVGGYPRPTLRLENPQFIGSDECSAGDCKRVEFSYDAHGNLMIERHLGGFGALGYGAMETSTLTEYRFGRPAKRSVIAGDGRELLLWVREIDPNTGRVRWHLGGDGSGFAYDYDLGGRVTDIVPVQGSVGSSGQRESVWTLGVQQYFDASSGQIEPMWGTSIKYEFPDDSDSSSPLLQTHTTQDWTYTLSNGHVEGVTSGSERNRFVFNGLGGLTQESERVPGIGWRSRFHLGFLATEGDASLCDPAASIGDPVRVKVELSSEWLGSDGWPAGQCLELPWTESLADGLARPLQVTVPDGSQIEFAYQGLLTSERTRSVQVELPGGANDVQPRSVVRIEDALGRLRQLHEQSDDNTWFTASYEYDVADRLIQASLLDPAGGSPQNRTWEYSAAGFLERSTEPERTVEYLAYDAAGNVRYQVTHDTELDPDPVTTFDYDEYGRLLRKKIDGQQYASFQYGDVAPTSGPADPSGFSTIGLPEYNKIVFAKQHNLPRPGGGVNWDVGVTTRWEYGAPGARVRTRDVEIEGFGNEGQTFSVDYEYDAWGNPAKTMLPRFDGCRASEWHAFGGAYDGPWQTSAARYTSSGTDRLADFSYLPSGRIETVTYRSGGAPVATLTEEAAPDAMARPESLTLKIGGIVEERGTFDSYAYDGSGNITAIGARAYAYDGLDRLAGFVLDRPDPDFDPGESYSYDRWGNLVGLSRAEPDGTGRFLDYVIDTVGGIPTNRLDAIEIASQQYPVVYDGRGNITALPQLPAGYDQGAKAFRFSLEDRLVESTADGVTRRYAYDTNGERVLEWRRSAGDIEATVSVRDEGGRLLSSWLYLEHDDELRLSRDFFYGAGRNLAQVDYVEDGYNILDMLRFHSHDHLGSTRVAFDDTGQVLEALEYYPYGGVMDLPGGYMPSPAASSSTHHFTGHERDRGSTSTELDYMHARYYSPNLGRFMSVDPIGGTVGSSQSWNRYSYVRNNPLTLIDPDGRRALVFIVSGGPDMSEKFGHAAMLVDAPSGQRATMSRGTPRQLTPSVSGFVNKYLKQGRTVTVYALTEDPARDERLAAAVQERSKDSFDEFRDNCSTGCANALRDAGVLSDSENPESGLFYDSPYALGDSLESGVLANDTETEVIIFDPRVVQEVGAEEIEQYLQIPDEVAEE